MPDGVAARPGRRVRVLRPARRRRPRRARRRSRRRGRRRALLRLGAGPSLCGLGARRPRCGALPARARALRPLARGTPRPPTAVASKSSHRTLCPPGTCRSSIAAPPVTSTGIHDRSPSTTSVGQIGHGGAADAISLQATTAASRLYRQRQRPSAPRTRCSAASRSRISRGVESSDPSARRASTESSGEPNETSDIARAARSSATATASCSAGSSSTARSTSSGRTAASSATSRPPKLCPIHAAPERPRAGGRLDQVPDVLGHPPRGQPRRAAVPAEVERDDAVLRKCHLRQPAVALGVPRQPVERDDGAAALGPERDRVQLHSRTTFPNCAPESMRSCAASASDRGRAVSTTGAHVPSSSMARSPAKSRGLPIVVPRSDTCPR